MIATDGTAFARAFVESLAREAGWPALLTPHCAILPGKSAWAYWARHASVLQLSEARQALAQRKGTEVVIRADSTPAPANFTGPEN
jgi:hypothetical protein